MPNLAKRKVEQRLLWVISDSQEDSAEAGLWGAWSIAVMELFSGDTGTKSDSPRGKGAWPSTAVRHCRLGKLPPLVELPFRSVDLVFTHNLVSTGSKNRGGGPRG